VLSEFPYTISQTSSAVACREITDRDEAASVAALGLGKVIVEVIPAG
jgi:hypothetical protein